MHIILSQSTSLIKIIAKFGFRESFIKLMFLQGINVLERKELITLPAYIDDLITLKIVQSLLFVLYDNLGFTVHPEKPVFSPIPKHWNFRGSLYILSTMFCRYLKKRSNRLENLVYILSLFVLLVNYFGRFTTSFPSNGGLITL